MLNPALIVAMYVIPGFNLVFRNFHVVDENLTRSAQLTSKQLEKLIQERGIKSLISLRGPNSNRKWYSDEIDILQRYGVEYAHLGLRRNRAPSQSDMSRILSVISDYPFPMHVQCKGGADRTGLFCSLYLLNKGYPMTQAIKQSSIYFGNLMPDQRRFLRDLERKNSLVPISV